MPTSVYRIVGNEVVRGVRSGSYIARGEFLKRSDALTELKHQLLRELSGSADSRFNALTGVLARVEAELLRALEAERPAHG